MADDLTFFHAPNTRSTGVAILLEELNAPYKLHVLNMKANEQRGSDFVAVNPMGKVPAVLAGSALVTEQPAIYIYLADLFADAGLAPAPDDPLRGPYLRWLVFYGSAFEPALVDRALKRDPGDRRMMPYGDYDTTLATVTDQLRRGPFILGERFTAADILWGTSLGWTTSFKLVPETPEIMRYIERIGSRPSVAKVRAMDAELAARHQAEPGQ